MLRSLSTSTLDGSWDGAPAAPLRRALSSTHWSRRFMPVGRSKAAWSIFRSRHPIKYSGQLAQAGIEPSVGGVGDSYDSALAKTVIGLFKTEVMHLRGPWRSFDAIEYATPEWVDWFNNRRLLEPIGNIPPAEAETVSIHWPHARAPMLIDQELGCDIDKELGGVARLLF